jgi:hypothetical protein
LSHADDPDDSAVGQIVSGLFGAVHGQLGEIVDSRRMDRNARICAAFVKKQNKKEIIPRERTMNEWHKRKKSLRISNATKKEA